MKKRFETDYRSALEKLLAYELENGAELIEGFTIETAIDDFMASDYTTVFELIHYIKK